MSYDPAILESQVVNLTSDLANKATDSLVLHLSASETVTGVKTFSTLPVLGTLSGLLKASSGSLSAAMAGTDYLSPSGSGASLTGIPESAVTGLTTDLAAKATDSLAMHLAGTETVTGTKGFTASIINFVSIIFSGLVALRAAGGYRWSVQLDGTAETGSNAGSNLNVNSWTDGSAPLSTYVTVNRATGNTTLTGSLTASAFSGSGASLTGIPESGVTNLTTDLAAKAPLASPALTGTPTAPTAGTLTNSTQVATTAYADAAVAVEKARGLAAETLLATDSLVVHKAGTETISGSKDFTANVGIGFASPTYALQIGLGGINVSGLATPATPTITVNTSGGNQNCYNIVAEDANGLKTMASPASALVNCPSTPNNTVNWTAVTGAVKYYILRSFSGVIAGQLSAEQVGTTSGATTFTDSGTPAGTNFTAPTFNQTANITTSGQVTASLFSGSGASLTALNPANLSSFVTAALGGTGITAYNLGDTIYASGTTAIAKLAGNTTAVKLFHTQTGTGSASTAPVWSAIAVSDLGVASPGMCQGRLTLTSGTAVTTADVTAATTLYFTPYTGSLIGLYSGSAWVMLQFTETTISLSGLAASTNYDIFAYSNSGVIAFDAPVAWTNGTTRAAALVLQNGVWCKSGATTRRYIGTIRTTATTGQTEDSMLNRFVWNAANPVERVVQATDATSSWTYATVAWRPGDNSTSNRVNVVIGLPISFVRMTLAVIMSAISGAAGCIGIGEDSTTVPHAYSQGDYGLYNAANYTTVRATLEYYPALGFHYYQWLEYAQTGTVTYYSNQVSGLNSGLAGVVRG